MSVPVLQHDTLFAQRLLKAAAFYAGELDGRWGKITQGASDAWDAKYRQLRNTLGEFDPRSESIISTLLPAAQVKAREFMKAVQEMPFQVKLLSGTRSYAEQNALFAHRPKVTNARGGQSNHNFGIAWDVGIFVDGRYYTGATRKEDEAYEDLARHIKGSVTGLEWGGDWKSFPDMPHYQLATGKSVSECRALLEIGKAYV